MHKQHGGVSIFIVIFTALLLTVVTTSFVRVMILNQQQATNNDLSQSAYDAAMAGVEDAKRALVAMRECEKTGCAQLDKYYNNMDNGKSCDSLGQGKIGVTNFINGEVAVGDESQNQAYTCVKIDRVTDVFDTAQLKAGDGPTVVHLKGVGDFDKVKVSWFKDGEDVSPGELDLSPRSLTELPSAESWGPERPSLLRTQLIQFDNSTGNIDLDLFNLTGTRNSRTLFLMPNGGGNSEATPVDFGVDGRRNVDATNTLKPVTCNLVKLNSTLFACSAELLLVEPERVPARSSDDNAAKMENREAFLSLSALYTGTKVRVQLINSVTGLTVKFAGAQPVVDSTGRSADQFRRVRAKIELSDGSGIYPDAALKVANSLCKNFSITNDPADYVDNGCGL